ncbi:galactarate dehydratase [Bryocella elongata]|uniref:Galactarate dehydratase n=1 Tax=Bryocella elongata TaxID=863522 RepID=A0A1H5ZJH6_9BACT|nr:galactarate dehydratase [Bryocella elongata]SEG36683.1 galactarate dehydratase [Bryocella elongata]
MSEGQIGDSQMKLRGRIDPNEPRYVRVHPNDNVAIIVNAGGLVAGTRFSSGLVLTDDVPEAHKVALSAIDEGSPIVRYGVVIGHAARAIHEGDWVMEDDLVAPPAPDLDSVPLATQTPASLPPLEGYTFQGYRNADGTVGTRNILGISTTVQCVAATVGYAVRRIKAELLPRYPNVDDVIAITHNYGCGVAMNAPGAEIPVRTLRNLSLNPNLGGAPMVASLGCEKLQPAQMLPASLLPILQENPYVVRLQDEQHMGFEDMVAALMELAERRLIALNDRRRVTCSASGLVVGMQCGGSDAFSGVTANPAVGFASDLLVRAGATVLFSEVTEVRDAVHLLTARAADHDVALRLVQEMRWYDEYLSRGSADRSANPSPGNKKGGLANIVEKAMGSVAKAGVSPLTAVSGPGERVTTKGLVFAATPASDFICGTLQLAAGMNMHVFTTGRGTPYGLAMVPVIKVATRTSLAERWHDLIDVDAGRIATGDATIEEIGWEIFHMILRSASGEHETWAEHWGLHNEYALFNPGPVT